jgi:hypothetical protein
MSDHRDIRIAQCAIALPGIDPSRDVEKAAYKVGHG